MTVADFDDGSATAESLESELVELGCVAFVNPPAVCVGGTNDGLPCPGGDPDCPAGVCEASFQAATNYTVTDGNCTATIRISTSDLNLVGTPVPCDAVNLTGIFSQFDPEPPTDNPPNNTGYRLLLTSLADINLATCADPSGACCLSGGACACSLASDSICTELGGAFQGDLSTCSACVAAPPCTCGDFNQPAPDGNVNLQDFAQFALCFGGLASSPGCECTDLDQNGSVNLFDFATFGVIFGKLASGSPPNCGAAP